MVDVVPLENVIYRSLYEKVCHEYDHQEMQNFFEYVRIDNSEQTILNMKIESDVNLSILMKSLITVFKENISNDISLKSFCEEIDSPPREHIKQTMAIYAGDYSNLNEMKKILFSLKNKFSKHNKTITELSTSLSIYGEPVVNKMIKLLKATMEESLLNDNKS